MKPFNLEAAKRGEPIITRDGRKAKFVAYVPEAEEFQQVLVLIDSHIWSCNSKGEAFAVDLCMAPPPMRSINGHEYPEPVREPLKKGQICYIPCPAVSSLYMACPWEGNLIDKFRLARGLVHLNKEAAIAQSTAIIFAGGGEA